MTYYVDFDAGNDSANGTSIGTAWLNLPGTRNVGDTGYLNTNSISAGDIIYIKAGTTHDSSKGGRIVISSAYYANNTSGSYITIQVSDSWGSGNVTIDGKGITVPQWTPLFLIDRRNHIEVKGGSSSKAIIIQNAPTGKLGFQSYGTSGSHQLGIKIRYMRFSGSRMGADFSFSDNFEARDCVAHNNVEHGFSTGGSNDQNCNGGTWQNCEAFNNGTSTSNAGFVIVGCTNITLRDCISHDNPHRNYDFGTSSNTNPCTVTVINGISYNGSDGGFCGNGGDGLTDSCVYSLINCISYNDNPNNQRGGFHFYTGCTVNLYHCISDKRGVLVGSFSLFSFQTSPGYGSIKAHIKNCVGYAPNGSGTNRWIYFIEEGTPGGPETVTLTVSNNIYDIRGTKYFYRKQHHNPLVATDHTFADWQAETHYGNPPDRSSSTSETIDTYWMDPTNRNYRLKVGSPLIGKGVRIDDPIEAKTDRDGRARSNPPTIGPYEYVGQEPAPPKGLAIIP